MERDVVFGEVIRQYFETVAEEMNTVLDRTAMSQIFNEAHDCSAGIFSYDGASPSLIARANAEPVHIYASLESVRGTLQYYRNDLHQGDIIVVNDPYAHGTHSADWTVVKPVFHEGRPIYFPGVRGHIIEHGSPMPGGLSPYQFEIWQESIRFIPIKLYSRGELMSDVLRWLEGNNRQAHVMRGDLYAMIGACHVAERRIRALIDRYGVSRVQEGVDYMLDYSERRVRSMIASWPDGTYFGRKMVDTDYAGHNDLQVDCTIVVNGDELTVDFTGTSPQGAGHINSTPGSTGSWVLLSLCAIMPDVPMNSGFLRPVRMVMPEGTLVNGKSPASVATNTVNMGSSIGDAVMKALEPLAPDRVGSVACDLSITAHWGQDVRFEDRPMFFNVDYLMSAVSASGAEGVDGWGGWSALHCSHRMPTVEMTEVTTPVFYRRAEFATDMMAPGKFRGAPGFVVERTNPEGQTVNWTLVAQSYRHPLPGWVGGGDGTPSYFVLDFGGPNEKIVGDYAFAYASAPGETIKAVSGGGGGWGPAVERDPEAVLHDVIDEYISPEMARTAYGVVITGGSTPGVDLAATCKLREAMKQVLAV